MPPTPAHEYVLRPGLPVPLVVIGTVLLALGVGIVAWMPAAPALVIGTAVGLLGLAAWVVALVRLAGRAQRITLDQVGLRLGMPRPADIAWEEIDAVHESGRVLRIELRDRTQFVVNGEVYRRGYAAFQAALVSRLSDGAS